MTTDAFSPRLSFTAGSVRRMDELLMAPAAKIQDLVSRRGFDDDFLGEHVPLPALPGVETVLLPYTHFSVLMRLDKRLAAVTGLGIDGAKLMDLDRDGINWRLDPRLDEDQQTGERVYARNDIDRGHLVRRASAVWGDTPRRGCPGKRRHLPLHERRAAGGEIQPGP